jgi:8-oxo-dGTP pyrophosphatase MutT (NUDIX family)
MLETGVDIVEIDRVAALAARYGEPRRVVAAIPSSAVQPLNMGDRIGEVCMVLRRPGGLLTAIKTFYPRGCYRLLTGGVEHGEPIEDALWREVGEETGLEVTATRFLAVIEYVEQGDWERRRQGDKETRYSDASAMQPLLPVSPSPSLPLSQSPPLPVSPSSFATFTFLLDAPHGEPVVHDPRERLESFREIAPAELPALAATLEGAPDEHNDEIDGNWRDWGVFRAVSHRVVHELLA